MSSKADNDENAQLSLTGMATQLGINVGIAVGVLLVFNILRPNNSRKMSIYMKKPTTVSNSSSSGLRTKVQIRY